METARTSYLRINTMVLDLYEEGTDVVSSK